MGSDRRRLDILAAAALLLAAGCADPEMPERDNPFDPGGTGFHDPGIELLAGPADGAVVTADQAAFRWRGTGYASLYSWCLDGGAWHDWTAVDSARLRHLDDGPHVFSVSAKTAAGVRMATPFQRRFIVDAVAAPCLVTVPRLVATGVGRMFSAQVRREGAAPLSAARVMLTYDPALMRLDHVYPHADWTAAGGQLVVTDSSAGGVIDVRYRLEPPGAGNPGSGIALLVMTALGAAEADSVIFTPAACLIGLSGDTIALAAVRGSIVTIDQR